MNDDIYPDWNYTATDPIGGFTGTSLPDVPSSWPSVSGLLDTVGSAVGKVADYGFGIQKLTLQNQAQAQDLQLKTLMSNLGFKTAAIQAQSQAQVAQINAQAQVAQAQRAAAGGTSSISPMFLALMGLGLFLAVKK